MSDPLTGFRDPALLKTLAAKLRGLHSDRPLRFMHVCGTHENAIGRFGLRSLLPDWLEVIAGPGCPVCVCPPTEIDLAARLALEHGATVATFGDMLPVPGRISLADARAMGAEIRIVRGVTDAVELAEAEPGREVVMLAVGFETTACTTAAAVLADPPANFTLLVAHRLIPPALHALLALQDLRIDGFLLPGHAITVTGTKPFEEIAVQSGLPSAVAGFEPVDILLGLAQLSQLAIDDRVAVANAYPRAVRRPGNPRARQAIQEAFVPVAASWRGLGSIPDSGLTLRAQFQELDALKRFRIAPDLTLPDSLPGCECGKVMVGLLDPTACPLFDEACTPQSPRGPCMVSQEGTCRSRFLYRQVARGGA